MDNFKKAIVDFLKKQTNLIEIELEVPPNPKMGDFAFPCFSLAKHLKKSPVDIARGLCEKFKKSQYIKDARPAGPYLNFFVNKDKNTEITIHNILKQKGKYGSLGIGKGKKIILEHTSINPNASPHVGRSRNALIGDSIARILRFQDYKVETHFLVNDVGKQIAMLVLGSEGKKNIAFDDLLDIYIKITKRIETNPGLEKDALGLLFQLEDGNKEVRKKFSDIVKICVKGQEKIFSEIGIKYDYFDYESEFLWSNETDAALKRLEKTGKLFIDKDDRWVMNQQGYGLGMKVPVLVLTRADKTSLYPLRDIAYNIQKEKMGQNIIVLGEDQKLYQEQISAALKELELKSPRAVHYSFVLLQEGKMSTRKGNLVLLEEFMSEALSKSSEELMKRYGKVDQKSAKVIAYGALKYSILRVSHEKNVTFNWEQALAFEGETAPYIQYAYARISSILKKAKINPNADLKSLVQDEESELITILSNFTNAVSKATEELKVHLIANFLYSLSQKFNEYYHKHQIIKAEQRIRDARLLLIMSVQIVIKNGLNLLGIDVLEKM
jgi:arginyl-tRNA synthetase